MSGLVSVTARITNVRFIQPETLDLTEFFTRTKKILRSIEQFESTRQDLSTDARISSVLLLEYFQNKLRNEYVQQEVLDFWSNKTLVPTEQRKFSIAWDTFG